MRCMENDDLLQALERLTARERYILFQRVLEGRSYEELSGPLGLRYSGTAAASRIAAYLDSFYKAAHRISYEGQYYEESYTLQRRLL